MQIMTLKQWHSNARASTYDESAPHAVADVVAGHVGTDGGDSERDGDESEQDVEQGENEDGDTQSGRLVVAGRTQNAVVLVHQVAGGLLQRHQLPRRLTRHRLAISLRHHHHHHHHIFV